MSHVFGRASDAGPSSRTRTVECVCGAIHADHSRDQHVVAPNPIQACDRCDHGTMCRECVHQCRGCGRRLCLGCTVEFIEAFYCPGCAARAIIDDIDLMRAKRLEGAVS